LGEHGELHKHRHNFVKQHKVNGRIYPVVQIEVASMEARHNELAIEMLKRGMNHESPYTQPDITYLGQEIINTKVDVNTSLTDLSNRCSKCKERIHNYIGEGLL